jgi:aryl-alcohol dehydrogenase-like predicted oxidoreductase
MEMRELGRSGLKVSPVCLGGNVFGWTADQQASFAVLDEFVGSGGNFIDTADVYSTWAEGHQGGESETVLGQWLKSRGNRDKVILATKVGSDMGQGRKGLKPAYIVQAVEDSLKRLQTDYIDLYQSHRDDPETPQEDVLEAYGKLIKAGKVRAIGASNFSAERTAEALAVSKEHGLPRYECLQPEYNLVARSSYETELEPLVRREGLGVTCYYALASGFLSGKYRSAADLAKSSARGGAAKRFLNPHGLGVLSALDNIAAAHRATPAQVALAWLIARPSVTAPIASATGVAQLQELLGAMQLTLGGDEIAALDRASAA